MIESTVRATSIATTSAFNGVKPLTSDTLTFQLPAAAPVSRVQVIYVSVAVTDEHSELANRTLTSSVVGRLVPVIVSVVPINC